MHSNLLQTDLLGEVKRSKVCPELWSPVLNVQRKVQNLKCEPGNDREDEEEKYNHLNADQLTGFSFPVIIGLRWFKSGRVGMRQRLEVVNFRRKLAPTLDLSGVVASIYQRLSVCFQHYLSNHQAEKKKTQVK